MASREPTGISLAPREKASPLAATTPARTPVKEPGPTPTAMAAISPERTWTSPSSPSTSRSSRSA
jgi:hypothetical protein